MPDLHFNRLLANSTRMPDLLSVEIGQVEIGLVEGRNRTGNIELQNVVLIRPVLFLLSLKT